MRNVQRIRGMYNLTCILAACIKTTSPGDKYSVITGANTICKMRMDRVIEIVEKTNTICLVYTR